MFSSVNHSWYAAQQLEVVASESTICEPLAVNRGVWLLLQEEAVKILFREASNPEMCAVQKGALTAMLLLEVPVFLTSAGLLSAVNIPGGFAAFHVSFAFIFCFKCWSCIQSILKATGMLLWVYFFSWVRRERNSGFWTFNLLSYLSLISYFCLVGVFGFCFCLFCFHVFWWEVCCFMFGFFFCCCRLCLFVYFCVSVGTCQDFDT